MYLFILESLGMQELALIGIIALIAFGPRKLPEMARKFGSMMTDFRRVSNEFKSTWNDAIDLEDGKNQLKEMKDELTPTNFFEEETNSIGKNNIAQGQTIPAETSSKPFVKEMSEKQFNDIVDAKKRKLKTTEIKPANTEKTDWL